MNALESFQHSHPSMDCIEILRGTIADECLCLGDVAEADIPMAMACLDTALYASSFGG